MSHVAERPIIFKPSPNDYRQREAKVLRTLDALLDDQKNLCCGYSAGKDSTTLANLMLTAARLRVEAAGACRSTASHNYTHSLRARATKTAPNKHKNACRATRQSSSLDFADSTTAYDEPCFQGSYAWFDRSTPMGKGERLWFCVVWVLCRRRWPWSAERRSSERLLTSHRSRYNQTQYSWERGVR
jgi:hypothetical protein